MDWLGLGTLVASIIDKIIPDKDARERAKAELALLDLQSEYENMKGQLEVNKAEAEHDSIFVSGWRPFIGWVCGISFAYHFVVVPIIAFVGGVPLPVFDTNNLLTVLLGMLGLGGMRSFEKMKGVARNKLNNK